MSSQEKEKTPRQFLIEDCQNNKQIKSCQQCLYEKECKQIHINLILKALHRFYEQKRQTLVTVDEVGQIQGEFLDELEADLER